MKRIIAIIIIIIITSIQLHAEKIEYIVKLKQKNYLGKAADKVLSSGAAVRSAFSFLNSKSFKQDRTLSTTQTEILNELANYHIVAIPIEQLETVLTHLRESQEVIEILPNYTYRLDRFSQPNDEKYQEQWALKQINAAKAWQKASGKGIVIGIIDTGIDFLHKDLVNNIWVNSKEDMNGNGRFDDWASTEIRDGVSGDLNGIDDDGNGFVDDVVGFDMVHQRIPNIGDWISPDPVPFDEHGHGTVVAGVIAAKKNNGIGIAGLAYNSKLMSIRAFDITGNGTSDNIAAAIIYAATNGAKVLNFSFGEVHSSPIMHSAIKFAHSLGVIMVASSGNENKDIKHYPSDYPEVIAVGASTADNRRWGFSNYGGNLCLIAPGHSVMTTTFGDSYEPKSGTSLAAPHVSASVALLLEINPEFTLSNIKGILSATATSVNPDGWDNFTGAGILNIGDAVDNAIPAKFEILSPKLYEAFNKSKISNIPIIGSTLTPLFDKYSVIIGRGKQPTIWDTIAPTRFHALLDDTLAWLDLSNLQDTLYTIAIDSKLKNGKIMQARTQINVFSNNNPFEIKDYHVYECYFNFRKAVVFSAVTTQDANFEIHLKNLTTGETRILSDDIEYSSNHQILLHNDFQEDTEYQATAIAYILGKDSSSKTLNFNIAKQRIPFNTFSRKPYSIPRAYIYNEVVDINNNGKPNIFYNDISNLSFGITYFTEFDGQQFNVLDSLKDGWLVAGIGDSNGDSIKDVLTFGSGQTQVYQSKQGNTSPFAEQIFSSNSRNFWAELYNDFNGNGREEIIAYNDTCYFAYTFKNGKYELLAQALLPNELRRIGIGRGAAAGDFNGNGKPNLYHSNNAGHSFIYEFDNNSFNLIYHNTDTQGAENQFITSLDVNGDGINEILHGTSSVLPSRNDRSNQLWKFRIIGYDGAGIFSVWDSVYIFGVRTGGISRLNATYRNGVAAGNLDGQIGDEIIISALPNLYIFQWNTAFKKMEPIWYYPASYSNSAFVFDFDKNNRSEIGFSTFGNTQFWEYIGDQNLLQAPIADGWALSDTSAYIFCEEIDNADEYELLYLADDNKLISIANQTTPYFYINGLSLNSEYIFYIIAKNSSNPDLNSDLSNKVVIYSANPTIIQSIEVESRNSISVHYSNKLPLFDLEKHLFSIKDMLGKSYSIQAVVPSSNKLIVITNEELEDGEYIFSNLSFRDYFGNYALSGEDKFIVNIAEYEDYIYLTRLISDTGFMLKLEFSEAPDTSAMKPENYTISPYGNVLFLSSIPGSPKEYDLAISINDRLLPRGKNYYLTARNIKTESGKKITTGAGNTLGFAISANNLNNMFIYPHPIRYSEQPDIYIAGLTRRAKVEILTLDGEVIAELYENDGNGGARWNGLDRLGNYLKPGVYLAKAKNIENIDADFNLIKFVVLP